MLVKGGYLHPDEVLSTDNEERLSNRMKKASQVFYDMMINENPELISPQHQAFYDAAVNNGTQDSDVTLLETHNDFNLRTLSNVLVGLAE